MEERPDSPMMTRAHSLRFQRLGIDTHQEAVVYMRQDCHVCRSEGFSAQARIQVSAGERTIVATLGQITTDLLAPGEASLSERAWRLLAVQDGDEIGLTHSAPLESFGHVRAKIYGHRLGERAMHEIMSDIVKGRYADVHLSAFITACSGQSMDLGEIQALTRAMVETGRRLDWSHKLIADKHCVGGLPGNRTTPIVVAIVAACGLTIPKTSSRAITSPAGTADMMETLAPVELDVNAMRRVVEKEGGCIIWGGAVDLSPVDDILVQTERALDLDSEGQLVASVLSKKIAAGATHLVLDMPVGPTAKVRSAGDANRLSALLHAGAVAAGMKVRVMQTDGTQPVGRGIGPALEARDVISVLRNEADAPNDLRQRAIALAGALLELAGSSPERRGAEMAGAVIHQGRAWQKFEAICQAQGGLREPPRARYTHPILASRNGRIGTINNRILARIAKLAGAPAAKAAGVALHTVAGQQIGAGEALYTIHAESRGELAYALDYAAAHADVMQVDIVT